MTLTVQEFLNFSALLASLIALGGVIWSNSKTSERQNDQLRHDSTERHRERIVSARIDVYLELLSAQPKAAEALSRLPDTDLTTGKPIAEFQGLISACSKCQLLGSQETASITMELQNSYAIALTKLLTAARPIHETNTNIKISDDLYKDSFADGQRILAQIKVENESGRPDRVRFDALMRAFENASATYNSFAEQRNEHWEGKLKLQREFIESIKSATDDLGNIMISLNQSMRDDLGLDTNLDLFKKRSNESRDKLFRTLDQFLDQTLSQGRTEA